MHPATPSYETLQRLAKTDLARAIELGATVGLRARDEALREALRGAGVGLSQVFGLVHRPVALSRPRSTAAR